jgi:hypothetical protein
MGDMHVEPSAFLALVMEEGAAEDMGNRID